MTAPTRRQFEGIVDELFSDRAATAWRRRLLDAYSWAEGSGHWPTVQEQANVRTTSPSTPTETIAASKAHIRRSMERAARNLTHARADIEEAERLMEHGMDSLNPAPAPDPLRFPRTVTQAELQASYGARGRREARGEAIP